MTEREQAHRHKLEADEQALQTKLLRRHQFIEVGGLIGGGTLLALSIAGAVYCATIGQWAVGVALVGFPVMSAVGILFNRKRKQQPSNQ